MRLKILLGSFLCNESIRQVKTTTRNFSIYYIKYYNSDQQATYRFMLNFPGLGKRCNMVSGFSHGEAPHLTHFLWFSFIFERYLESANRTTSLLSHFTDYTTGGTEGEALTLKQSHCLNHESLSHTKHGFHNKLKSEEQMLNSTISRYRKPKIKFI